MTTPEVAPALTPEQALAELVACEDLKTRAGKISPVEPGCEKEVLMDEYRRRMPTAWHYARAALASVRAQSSETPAFVLPEPAFWVAEESKRHGMHPAYRSAQARLKYGGEGVWFGHYSAKQVEECVRAALASGSQSHPDPVSVWQAGYDAGMDYSGRLQAADQQGRRGPRIDTTEPTNPYGGHPVAPEPRIAEPWQPCTNCSLDSTGKMTHCIGCPNDPNVYRAAANPIERAGLTDEQREEIHEALPKVGENEEAWTSVRGSTLRAIDRALATPTEAASVPPEPVAVLVRDKYRPLDVHFARAAFDLKPGRYGLILHPLAPAETLLGIPHKEVAASTPVKAEGE